MSAEEIFSRIHSSIKDVEPPELEKAISDALREELDPVKVMEEMGDAGVELGERYANNEIGLPEVLVLGKMLEKALNTLKPYFPKVEARVKKGTIVIGTVVTDVHSIGKNLVATLLKNSGYEVYDLGEDVPTQKFVEKAREVEADIIGVSALLTSSMLYIKDVIKDIEAAGMRDKVKVIVGGGSISPEHAKSLGADAYCENVSKSIEVINKIMSERRNT